MCLLEDIAWMVINYLSSNNVRPKHIDTNYNDVHNM